ncbi:3-deoxy-manno-octulosonate cytidylyltransferase [Vibrio sp.]|nr:3-deoxy-manno-octulosonate cytidylyltransferase [Vibrio sp.]
MSFTVVIPARYNSSRLPGKPLADICGKTMIQRVHEQAMQAGANNVIIATDDARVQAAAEAFGANVCMTSANHESGTERLAEVIERMGIRDDEIVVNVQGDEPLIPPSNITQVAANLARSKAEMATLAVEIVDENDVFNPNVVKVVMDEKGYALYFSRASIPWDRDNFSTKEKKVETPLKRHVGIYAYNAGFVRRYLDWLPSPLEKIESLEQLRVLWYGEKIHVDIAREVPPHGVDTQDDLEAVIAIVKSEQN